MCDSSLFFLPSLHLSFALLMESRRQSAVWKCKMLLSDLRRAAVPPYDGWVWDLERPPVQHWPFLLFSARFPHLSRVYRPHRAPGWLSLAGDICNKLKEPFRWLNRRPHFMKQKQRGWQIKRFHTSAFLQRLGIWNVSSVQITGWTWPRESLSIDQFNLSGCNQTALTP